MAYKQKHGTFMLNKKFPGMGRIQRASGTNDLRTFNAIRVMLDELYSTGKLEILKEIQSGAVKPMKVYSLWKAGQLSTAMSTVAFAPLADVKDYIANRAEIGAGTRTNYLSLYRVLTEKYGENHTIERIPSLLDQFRADCIKKHIRHRSFNQTRSMFQSYCHNTKGIGRQHPLWLAISNVKPIKYKAERKPALSVHQVVALMKAVDYKPYEQMIWTLATTGMRKAEYATPLWEEKTDRILVHGTKRKASDRVIPRICPVYHPQRMMQQCERRIREVRTALPFKVSPHVLRHTYAHWLELAGIPKARHNSYMGHEFKNIAEIYTYAEVENYLVEDAETLRNWIEAEKQKPIRKEKVRDTYKQEATTVIEAS